MNTTYRFNAAMIFAVCFFLQSPPTEQGPKMESSESFQQADVALEYSSLRQVTPDITLQQITLPEGGTAVLLTEIMEPPQINQEPIIQRDTLTGLSPGSNQVTLPYWLLMVWAAIKTVSSMMFSPLTVGLITLAVSVSTLLAMRNVIRDRQQNAEGQNQESSSQTRKRA